MTVLCFGAEDAYSNYKRGMYPSHLLYGAIEIEKAGYNLVIKPSSSKGKFFKYFDVARRIMSTKHDVLFLPFISREIFIVVLAKKLGLFKKPIVGWSHRTIKSKNGISKLFLRFYYSTFDQLFFLSPLNLKESIESGVVSVNRIMFSEWGADLKFYDKILKHSHKQERPFFISTGKENRDFDTLINVFKNNRKFRLHIYTNLSHAGRGYSFLKDIKGRYPNIEIKLIENDNDSLLTLAKVTANSFCVTIPLINSEVNYCVGLSSIVEALALGKPLLISKNSYHPFDVEEKKIGIAIDDDAESWNQAINFLIDNPTIAEEMGKNARKLAEEKYNIEFTSSTLLSYLSRLEDKHGS